MKKKSPILVVFIVMLCVGLLALVVSRSSSQNEEQSTLFSSLAELFTVKSLQSPTPQPIVPTSMPTSMPTVSVSPSADNPLAGTSWKLVVMMIEGVGQEPPSGSTVTLKFDNSELNGNNSCNSYFGSYTVDGETIKVGQMGSTTMACESTGDFESTYMKTLGEAGSFTLHSGNKLTIYSATTGKTALDYEKAQ